MRKTIFWVTVVALTVLSQPALTIADDIANVFEDFSVPASTGWSYHWNPAGVSIGDGEKYVAIPVFNDKFYAERTAATAAGTNSSHGNVVDVRIGGKTPNLRIISGLDAKVAAADGGDEIDHYSILRYTVQSGEEGNVTFDSSKISFNKNAGNKIVAYKNNVLVDTIEGTGNVTNVSIDFGAVVAGDTLDLAFLTPDGGVTAFDRRISLSSTESHVFSRTAPETP